MYPGGLHGGGEGDSTCLGLEDALKWTGGEEKEG